VNTNFEENKPYYMVIGLLIVVTVLVGAILFAAEADGLMVATMGIIMGLAYRNFFPYWEKLKNGTITSYNLWYAVTAILSFLAALYTIPAMLEQFVLTIDPLWSTMLTLFNAILFAAIYNGTVNYLFMDNH